MRKLGPYRRSALLVAMVLISVPIFGACAGSVEVPNVDAGACARLPAVCGNVQRGCCNAASVCAEQVCQGVRYTCMAGADGIYSWSDQPVFCDDGDLCTDGDRCTAGYCAGTPKICNTPPPTICADGKSLKTFAANGKCVGGSCGYLSRTTPCAAICKNGACEGQPCLGIKCDTPPSKCNTNPGTCNNGKCDYALLPVGSACSTSDPCSVGGICDGSGVCQATGKSCKAAHASGGNCVGGKCQGFVCDAGWGDCNQSWSDGCETPLSSTNHCGKCGKKCSAGAHATASCQSGVCKFGCKSPWQDCNKSSADGCEIPVGVANRCDRSGLNSATGCGTAYCGSSSSSRAQNFGSWTCVSCVQCHLWSNGYSWCLTASGKFSSDRCPSCCNSGSTDKVCAK